MKNIVKKQNILLGIIVAVVGCWLHADNIVQKPSFIALKPSTPILKKPNISEKILNEISYLKSKIAEKKAEITQQEEFKYIRLLFEFPERNNKINDAQEVARLKKIEKEKQIQSFDEKIKTERQHEINNLAKIQEKIDAFEHENKRQKQRITWEQQYPKDWKNFLRFQRSNRFEINRFLKNISRQEKEQNNWKMFYGLPSSPPNTVVQTGPFLLRDRSQKEIDQELVEQKKAVKSTKIINTIANIEDSIIKAEINNFIDKINFNALKEHYPQFLKTYNYETALTSWIKDYQKNSRKQVAEKAKSLRVLAPYVLKKVINKLYDELLSNASLGEENDYMKVTTSLIDTINHITPYISVYSASNSGDKDIKNIENSLTYLNNEIENMALYLKDGKCQKSHYSSILPTNGIDQKIIAIRKNIEKSLKNYWNDYKLYGSYYERFDNDCSYDNVDKEFPQNLFESFNDKNCKKLTEEQEKLWYENLEKKQDEQRKDILKNFKEINEQFDLKIKKKNELKNKNELNVPDDELIRRFDNITPDGEKALTDTYSSPLSNIDSTVIVGMHKNYAKIIESIIKDYL